MTYDNIFFKIFEYPSEETMQKLTHYLRTHYTVQEVYDYPDGMIQILLFPDDADIMRNLL